MTDPVGSFRDDEEQSAEPITLPEGRQYDQGSSGLSPLSNSIGPSDQEGLLSTSCRDDSSPVSIGRGNETSYARVAKQLSASSVSSIPSPSSTAFYPHYQVSSVAANSVTLTQTTVSSAPLNVNWETYYTDGGKPYYYNTMTGITQWEKPSELQQPMNQKSDAPVLPACQPLGTDPGKAGPAGANLFIFYLPPAWSEPELFAAFQAYGTIVSARVQRDAFGRSRGYGFISYDTSDSAQGAIRGMDGAAVGDENPMLRKFSRTASLLVGFQ